ncbi:MAG: STAS domain-containing protein [Syntrophales bacterium]|jgi:anti-anti-sigma factor|nr:STAS domain-containing protein [Syntrophales bacterium]MCK9392543.1 STAS domain-containing protein [Syntrophales bacterium]
MGLDIHITTKGEGSYVVILNGSLDNKTYDSCQRKLEPILNSRTRALHFDMFMLSYMNSMGLRLLLNVKKVIEDKGGQFQMLNMQPQIMTLMDIAAGPVRKLRTAMCSIPILRTTHIHKEDKKTVLNNKRRRVSK